MGYGNRRPVTGRAQTQANQAHRAWEVRRDDLLRQAIDALTAGDVATYTAREAEAKALVEPPKFA